MPISHIVSMLSRHKKWNMKVFLTIKYLLFLVLFSSPLNAGVYMEFSPALINVDMPAANTSPLLADIRLGYAKTAHQFELAIMTSVKDDSLNQLTVDVPAVVSVLYHFLPVTNSSLKLHLILGASMVDVDSSYPGIASSSDSFHGVSYGIGFEESFKSMPQLKISLDWIRLYHGDQLDIDATSLGVHYEF